MQHADTQVRVLAFFENRFQVVPDVSALAGRLEGSGCSLPIHQTKNYCDLVAVTADSVDGPEHRS